MPFGTTKSVLIAGIVASVFAGMSAHAAALEPQTSQAGGVAIQVAPIQVGSSDHEWQFAVALNTHSQNLADDLATEAVIVDGAGRTHAALAWDGDAAGGHHRKGVLRFAPLSPKPARIELRIQRANETEPRTFRWPPE